MKRFLIKSIIIIAFLPTLLFSEDNAFSLEGKQFGFVLLENQRFSGNPERQKEYEYSVAIIARDSCTARIYHHSFKDTVKIPVVPDKIARFQFDYNLTRIKTDTINSNVIEINSDKNIRVYSVAKTEQSVETFSLIPESSWGRKYVSSNYFNFQDVFFSETAVIAGSRPVHTNLTPRFIGAMYLEKVNVVINHDLDPFTSFCILQSPDRNLAYAPDIPFDLTGTYVESEQPLSMISGHQCAQIPSGETGCDFLAEQMIAYEYAAKEYIIPPLPDNIGTSSRIIAFEDQTNIIINGVTVNTIDRGEFHDIKAHDSVVVVQSNNVIYATQYSHGYGGKDGKGDPMMVSIPSEKTFSKDYILTPPVEGKYKDFAIILAREESIGKIEYDGIVIPKNYFSKSKDGMWYFYQIPMKPGIHRLKSTENFGVYQFGYCIEKNNYNAYGNL